MLCKLHQFRLAPVIHIKHSLEIIGELLAEEGRVVGVDGNADAGPQELIQPQVFQRADKPRQQIGKRVCLQRDAVLLEQRNQRAVCTHRNAVPDARCAQHADRAAHVLRALCAHLSGVRHAPKL